MSFFKIHTALHICIKLKKTDKLNCFSNSGLKTYRQTAPKLHLSLEGRNALSDFCMHLAILLQLMHHN